MFKVFRVILILLTLATTLLSIFALTGSYKNESYLTNTYLININLSNLDLSKILKLDEFPKRDLEHLTNELGKRTDLVARSNEISEPVAEKRDVQSWANNIKTDAANVATQIATVLGTSVPTAVASALPASVTSSLPQAISGGYFTTVQAVISDIINNFTYDQLGLADVYTISYWGYCRGMTTSKKTYDTKLNKYLKPFDNDKVNVTWCSKPQAAYALDPLGLIKAELNNTINDKLSDLPSALTATAKSEIKVLLDNITYETLDFPDDLQKKIKVLNNVTKASFAILVVVCVLGFLSLIIQCLAFCFSPSSCCLSFLNFLFESVIFILAVVAAALITGAYLFVRQKVNDETKEYGVKTFLSINFYAFIWSGVVAALLVVIFSLLGHCCGCFGTGRRRYKKVEPEAAYEHHDDASSMESEK